MKGTMKTLCSYLHCVLRFGDWSHTSYRAQYEAITSHSHCTLSSIFSLLFCLSDSSVNRRESPQWSHAQSFHEFRYCTSSRGLNASFNHCLIIRSFSQIFPIALSFDIPNYWLTVQTRLQEISQEVFNCLFQSSKFESALSVEITSTLVPHTAPLINEVILWRWQLWGYLHSNQWVGELLLWQTYSNLLIKTIISGVY